MKILTPEQIRAIDAYTVEHEPIASIDLMERAATACMRWITERFDRHRKMVVLVGPGNNGGDGLAVARMLSDQHYDVSVYMLTDAGRLSPDASVNYRRLTGRKPIMLSDETMPDILPSTVVIDAMFGVGLSRSLEGLAARTVMHVNQTGATIIAVDMPSGLFCENNDGNDPNAVIRARYTLTFHRPKLSFFFAENASFVGNVTVLDIGLSEEFTEVQSSKNFVLTTQDIANAIKPREKFAHKGNFGHACIVAGSHGMVGAAVLSVRACLRAGVGLVTAHVPERENPIMQISVPEALVSSDIRPEIISQIPDLIPYSAVAFGPGTGKKAETQRALLALLNMMNSGNSGVPTRLVLDADALNILSENKDWMNLLPANSIITPHPGEFDRLAGRSETGYQRYLKQTEMARKYAVFVVLKGAHTSVAAPDGSCFFNTTGNPGMATGGSGDVLTGIIVSLSAQGLSPSQAACAGVWLHGTAGDAAAIKSGQQALIASDIVRNIGKAFKKLQNG